MPISGSTLFLNETGHLDLVLSFVYTPGEIMRVPATVRIPVETFHKAHEQLPQVVKEDYKPCPRCGQEHLQLEMHKFQKPMITEEMTNDRGSVEFISGYFNHWAICPTTSEPLVFAYNLRGK